MQTSGQNCLNRACFSELVYYRFEGQFKIFRIKTAESGEVPLSAPTADNH